MVVRGHFDGRVIVLDEPADLPRNQPLIVHVEPAPTSERAKEESALGWMVENAIDDPSLPSDLSANHDHYLYGTPKREP